MNSPHLDAFEHWRKPTKQGYRNAFAGWDYPQNTQFGPFNTKCPSKANNWMLNVRRVAFEKAANLVATKEDGNIFFTGKGNIKKEAELLFWMDNKREGIFVRHVISDGIDRLVDQLSKLELEKEKKEKRKNEKENPSYAFDIQLNKQLNTLPDFAQLARVNNNDNDIDRYTITFEVIKIEKPDVESCHSEPCHSEPCRSEPCRSEPCHSEPCRSEPCRSEPCRSEPCRSEPCRSEPCRSEPCRSEPCRSEPCRSESCHYISDDDLNSLVNNTSNNQLKTVFYSDLELCSSSNSTNESARIDERLMENTLVSSISTETVSTSSTVQHLTLDKTTSPTSVGAISKDSTPKRGKENKKRRRGRPKKNSEFKQLESAKTNESSKIRRDYSRMPNEPCQPETCSGEQVVTNNLQSINVNESLHRTEADCSNNSVIIDNTQSSEDSVQIIETLNTLCASKNSETDDVFDKFGNIFNSQSSEGNVQDSESSIPLYNYLYDYIENEENLEKLNACGVTEDSRSDGVVSKEVFTDNSDSPRIKLVLRRTAETGSWTVPHDVEVNGTEAITDAIVLDLSKKNCNIELNKEMCPAKPPAENSNSSEFILKKRLEKRRYEEIESTDGADLAISEEPIVVPDENIVIPEMPISEGNIVIPEMPISEENIVIPEMPISEENIVTPEMPILEENIVISEMPILEQITAQDTTVLQDSDDVIEDITIDQSNDKILDQDEDAALAPGHKTESAKESRKKKEGSRKKCAADQQERLKAGSSEKSGEFLCEFCDKSFLLKAFLWTHRLVHHKDSAQTSKRKHDSSGDEVPIVKKPHLDNKFNSPRKTSLSGETSHSVRSSIPLRKFICSKCGQKFAKEKCLKFCCSE